MLPMCLDPCRSRAACAVAIAIALGAGHASAQEADAKTDQKAPKKGRSVGEHTFSEFRAVAWPFVSTRVRTVTGFGLAEFDAQSDVFDRTFSGNFVSLTEEIRFAFRITDWLGFELEGSAGVLGGTNKGGAFFVGANGGFGGAAALVLRLVETDQLYLSARFEGGSLDLAGVAPARLLGSISATGPGDITLDEVSLSDLRITASGSQHYGAAELGGAWGIDELWGLLASARLEESRTSINDSHDWAMTLEGGLGLSVNLIAYGFPCQFLAGGRIAGDIGADSNDVAFSAVEPVKSFRVDPELGIFYTGRRNLELGLSVLGRVAKGNTRRSEAFFTLGYFW